MQRRTSLALIPAALVLGLSACGGDAERTASGGAGAASPTGAPRAPVPPATAPGLTYLALGDSLGRGVQPDPAVSLTHGYPRYLAKRLRRDDRGEPVSVVEAACGGATTASFIDGGQPCSPPADVAPIPYANRDAATGQLAWAEATIRARGDRPLLVTLTIGGNDLRACVSKDASAIRSCIADGGPGFAARLEEIVTRLKAAGGKEAVFVGATTYDPFLGALRTGSLPRDAVETMHRAIVEQVNPLIRRTLTRAGWEVADLGRAAKERSTAGGADSDAVRTVCRTTWSCDRDDVHLNSTGAAAAARVFAEAAGR